jgi:polyisoprenoid-binding protein YceI
MLEEFINKVYKNMKKIMFVNALVIASAAMLGGCSQAPESDQAEVGDAQEVQEAGAAMVADVDLASSKVEWVGTKVTGRHNGEIRLSKGSLQLAEGALVGGNFTLDMNSISTTDKMGADNGLTDHLKSSDFFDVEKYPTAEFVITGIKALESAPVDAEDVPEINQYKISNPTHTITGNLTMKGVTKSVSFPAAVSMSDGAVNATAKFNINRSDWGISYPGKPDDLIREVVHIGIALKAAVPLS